MTVFAVTYRYTDDPAARDEFRPEHRDYLRGLADRGIVAVSGPYGADEQAGALLVFKASSKDEVFALVEKDPFKIRGLIAEVAVTEWEPVIGPLAKEF
ncbi:YciI family protein [Saccharopolyspora sp. K220]|uniref:YciI family protein n=1 Tax=Saccharopolyspora soli TaxID=2926618 RepID=UPI001F55CC56|nr:YciI family protein [Saccharopolyspora soli]MCI2416628.1 YciI family protein [Saccharopolyspora soli]